MKSIDIPLLDELKYVCVERLVAQNEQIFEMGDTISQDLYIYLQPSEREHFDELR